MVTLVPYLVSCPLKLPCHLSTCPLFLPCCKILRLNLDGSIPSDNPVANNPYWSFGHRNPQGLVFANNRLYSSEHGPNNDDEINIIEKGRNYGWPNVQGYCDNGSEPAFCNNNNVVQPIEA